MSDLIHRAERRCDRAEASVRLLHHTLEVPPC